MGRLILLVILGLAVAMYFPDSRAALMEKGEPLLRPVLKWNASREMDQIASAIQTEEEDRQRLPDKREYVKFLQEHFTDDVMRDPWGNVYGYEIKADSFSIISDGPDREFKTADDIRDTRLRNWKAKGKGKP
jgi:hypothetical protein